MMNFRKINLKTLQFNPMTMIADEWWLVTAGNAERGYNTMTASWGHLGAIWGNGVGSMPTAVIYIRPQRYTKVFVDREDVFSLCVLGEAYRRELNYLGSRSGRDEDKIAAMGLTPVFGEGTTYFAEAKLVFICKKLYHAPLVEAGFESMETVERNYPNRDFHEMYVGRIDAVLQRD